MVECDGFVDFLDHPFKTPDASFDCVDEFNVLLNLFGVDGFLAF